MTISFELDVNRRVGKGQHDIYHGITYLSLVMQMRGKESEKTAN